MLAADPRIAADTGQGASNGIRRVDLFHRLLDYAGGVTPDPTNGRFRRSRQDDLLRVPAEHLDDRRARPLAGLTVGLQIIGPEGEDPTTIGFARLLGLAFKNVPAVGVNATR
jgi:hypothetical protein